jgi:Tol biopolymer transport system component
VLTSREVTAEMMTGQGMILGTPGYLSPEQARGQEANKRADIWAFGVVLYEMLTGGRLFEGDTAAEALAAVLRHEPDLERVPAKARKLLGSCLEKDPKRRLRDIGDACRLVEETTVSAVKPPPNKFWAAVAAALALVAAGAGAGWWRAARSPDRPLMRYALDLGPDAFGSAEADIAISPDGHRIVFPVRRPDGKVQLATRLVDQSQSTLLPGTEGGTQPFFSPDSQWLAFFAGGVLSKISVQGGAPVALANTTANSNGGSWDQGSIVAALSHATSLSLIPAGGGAARLLTKLNGDEATHRWPQLLPAGNVLFTESVSASGMESANIAVADRKTGTHKIVLRGGFSGQYVPGGYLLYVHQGVLFAVRFDSSREDVQGSPVPLVEDLAADSMQGNGRFHFSSAPDGAGTLIYVAGKSTEQKWAVTMVDHSGGARPLIAPGAYYNPAFSPDGRRLALVLGSQGTDIFVYDVARGTMTRLTSDAASDRPVWTPDGAKIVFASKRSPPGLWWMRSDGGAEPELLLRSDHSVMPWSISPDGRRLLYFEIAPDTGYDLGLLPLDLSNPAEIKPGKPEAFLRTQFNEACPSFSPDGRWVAYFSNESGLNEVYVRPSTGDGKWQISSGGGMFAAWSPNGRELYYEGLDNRIQVVDYVAKGASFEAGRPRQWSGRQLQNVFKSNFTVAPDGKGIAIFEAPDGSKTPLHVGVLLNFLDELKRRLP